MLKPADFHILLSLLEEERHGYGIRQDVARATGGALVLDAGNLYRSIRRLLEAELLVKSGRKPAGDERRVYYRLTSRGRATILAEARRLQGLLRMGKLRKLLSESSS